MNSRDIKLPPLPKASKMYDIPGYDEEELKDYARAAVLADRERRFLKERAQLDQEWSVIEELRNQRAQPAPGAWQPIETAPKPDIGADGFGKRLLLVVDCGEGTIASVRKGYWEGADWYLDCCMGLATAYGYRVTHWQPLPEPPTGDKQQ